MTTIGIDIGGANLKYCTDRRRTLSRNFALWKYPDRLCQQLIDDLATLSDSAPIAVTMTGELADCFLDREEGVKQIVASVQEACAGKEIGYYSIDGKFLPADIAIEKVDLVAASNWHALGNYVAKEIATDGILVDIGSTTTDLIPLSDGKVCSRATTDHERLVEGSLVYVGCSRTPVCAIVNQMFYRGTSVRVMNEVFATMDDVGLLLDWFPEQPNDSVQPNETETADGNPRTRFHATNRMARMIGLDHRSVTENEAQIMAAAVRDATSTMIEQAAESLAIKYPSIRSGTVVISGHGGGLLPSSIINGRNVIRLTHKWGEDVARCAPAYAVCKLFGNR